MKKLVLITIVTVVLATCFLVFFAPPAQAATFGEVTEWFADGSERTYTIRFLPDGRECIWLAPVVTYCPPPTPQYPTCQAQSAPPPAIPSCISLCTGGLWNMVCPWE